ncbi:hypothetical protein O181_000606 [Austropuccinia psidii MF-1]|uniref:Uncharacterized protein n=1 Tax=Austropuccinia psidii MF-1 TaxID=1389203 RepID=A0A9Q3B8U2_9BASI|nr:hypothetical protein [Austropuccinia psidii MF-1]
MEILHQHQQSQTPKGSPKCEIWDELVWRCFTGTRNINDLPFMSIPGALAFSIYVDWFNAHGKSTQLASIGPIMLICLNIPPSERFNPENFYIAGIIPGPKEPSALQLNYLLMPLIKELKELWKGCHFSPTSTGPSGSFICVSILMAVADLVAMRKLTGFFLIQETTFVIFALLTKLKLKKSVPDFTTHTHTKIMNQPLKNGFVNPQNKDKQSFLSMESDIQCWKTFHIEMQPEWLILT